MCNANLLAGAQQQAYAGAGIPGVVVCFSQQLLLQAKQALSKASVGKSGTKERQQ
jgi:hypothetical protein